MKKNIITVLLLGALAPGLTGCATIMDGSNQSIGFSSTPANATVTVDGNVLGKTPLTRDLSRKDNHSVKITLAGYIPYEMTMTRKTNGWVWGNILFGGLFGLVIDVAGGGMYKLTPEQVNAELRKQGSASVRLIDDTILVSVTLDPDPSWQKVGQLEKL